MVGAVAREGAIPGAVPGRYKLYAAVGAGCHVLSIEVDEMRLGFDAVRVVAGSAGCAVFLDML